MFSSPKFSRHQYSTKQCQEMMKKDFRQFVDQHIINQEQQELIQNYSLALDKDRNQEEIIKQKLNHSFFNKHKQRRNIKQELRSQFAHYNNQNQQIKQRLTEELKKSLNFSKSSRKKLVRTPQLSKNRYSQFLQAQQTFQRPRTNRSSFQQRGQDYLTLNKCNISNYSVQIQNIIDQSNRLKSKTSNKKRNIMTASQRKNRLIQQDKTQKESIISKIIENDVQQYLKNYTVQNMKEVNPQAKRKIFEQNRNKELKNLQKYNMSFTNYIKHKTKRNIENSIYNDKIRQKDSYVQKFQRYILDQLKFSEQAKRRLEKIFKAIELEYKRPIKNRQIGQRLSYK